MKIASFILPLPPSVNCLYDGGKSVSRRFKSDRYEEWCRKAKPFVRAFMADNPDFSIFNEPVGVFYRFGEIDDKKRRDVANYEKAVSDLMVDEEILVDDSLIGRICLEWADDVQPGYVEAIMIPLSKMAVKIG